MIKFFKNVQRWYRSLRYFIVVDPADNSVTLSKALFAHIRKNALGEDKAQVFVFQASDTKQFSFMVNPQIDKPTQLCEIQYNDKHKCIGFETLNPSVGKMLYEYAMPHDAICKLSVSLRKSGEKFFYQIDKPKKQ